MTPLERAHELQGAGLHPFYARCQAASEAGVHVSEINLAARVEGRKARAARLEAIGTVPANAWSD